MHRKGRLKQSRQLLDIRRAKRLAADMAVAAAAAAEQDAILEQKESDAQSSEAQLQWAEHIGARNFSPEYARALGTRLIVREEQSQQAALVTQRKSELHDARRQEWRQSEAHARQSLETVRKLRREVEYRREEARLAELGDRATQNWRRT
jgi:hypothetical protein